MLYIFHSESRKLHWRAERKLNTRNPEYVKKTREEEDKKIKVLSYTLSLEKVSDQLNVYRKWIVYIVLKPAGGRSVE